MTNSDSSSTDTNRIRLVTVSQFPTPSALTSVPSADKFATQCAVFENHYLQHTEWASQSCADGVATIGEIAKRFPSSCRALIFRPPSETADTQNLDWCEILPVQESTEWPSAQTIAKHVSELRQFQFVWLHFELPDSDDEAAFESILQAMVQLRETERAVTILTTVKGSAPHLPTPFASLAPDSMLRVPLWIDIPHREGCSIQTITGTSDLTFTIQQLLASTSTKVKEDANVLNLINVSRSPGDQIPRTLIMQQNRLQAVRTNDFLFARITDANRPDLPDEQTCALYAKPEDVWNIHDVYREYEAVAVDLAENLDQLRP